MHLPKKVAKMFNGHPMTTITEILFNVPFTAHCMGGCAIASKPRARRGRWTKPSV